MYRKPSLHQNSEHCSINNQDHNSIIIFDNLKIEMNRTEGPDEQQKDLEQTVHLTEELRNELLSIDLSKFKVPRVKIHPQWESIFQFTQQKGTAELGPDPELKLSKDLCGFSFYSFPSLSYDFVSCILIHNMAGFVLDDYLDKFPSGKKK